MRTYKYPIRNHPKNKRLGNLLDELANVHNHFLRLEKRYYRRYGKYAGRLRLQPHLTKLLKRTKKHWAWIPRDILDAVIIRIDQGYRRFFDDREKGGNRIGPPKLKSKRRYRSARFRTGYKLEAGRIRISFKPWNVDSQSLKFDRHWFSFHQHRDWNGNVRYVQISRDPMGEYWLTVVTDDVSTEPLPATGESVGADFGMETFLTLSTGEQIHVPQVLKESLRALRTLNKSVRRKRKGSGNWWRAVRELARLYQKISFQRLDWHWKLATDLCRRFDTIATETLNIDAMKRLWGREVPDLAFPEFVEILTYKCQKHTRQLLQVGQWTATPKPCSACGFPNASLTLSDREWRCPECGKPNDRGVNAAIHILRGCLAPRVETA